MNRLELCDAVRFVDNNRIVDRVGNGRTILHRLRNHGQQKGGREDRCLPVSRDAVEAEYDLAVNNDPERGTIREDLLSR